MSQKRKYSSHDKPDSDALLACFFYDIYSHIKEHSYEMTPPHFSLFSKKQKTA